MKKILLIPIISLLLSGPALTGYYLSVITDTEIYWPAPPLVKPGYLETVLDPVFNTRLTRIVGNPGAAIPNLDGEVWADEQLRHGYSKRQPWNADQTMLYLDRHDPELWIDGNTYRPLFTRKNKPGTSLRWSPVEPRIMFYLGREGNEHLGRWDVVANQSEELLDLRAYRDISFGEGEGNFTWDGRRVAICAVRRSDDHPVVFVADAAARTKGPDIDISALAELKNCTISPLGNYIVIGADLDGSGSDRIQVRSAVTGEILWQENRYGLPSHFDTQVDEQGEEVIVGVGKTAPYSGMIIKRRLADGAINVLVDQGYASHTSGRCIRRKNWVYVTYQIRDNSSWWPFRNEIVAVKLDGSRIERLGNLHAIKFDYLAESHGCPSPDGTRVIFASDWENGDFPVQAYVIDLRDKVIPAR
jgi:hypothetical protein